MTRYNHEPEPNENDEWIWWTGNRIGCDVRSCTGVRCFRQLQLRVKVREKKEERRDKTGQEMMTWVRTKWKMQGRAGE